MQKQEKKTSAIWALFIAFIMVSSILGYAIFGGDAAQKQSYGKYKFTRTEQGWFTKIDNQRVFFNFHPLELENINISKEIIDSIKNTSMLYLAFDPEQRYLDYIDLARFQLTESFWTFFHIYPKSVVTKSSSKYNMTVINCTNATSTIPVIFFKQSNETGFDKQDNCLLLRSTDGFGFLRLKDRLLYGLLDIIQ